MNNNNNNKTKPQGNPTFRRKSGALLPPTIGNRRVKYINTLLGFNLLQLYDFVGELLFQDLYNILKHLFQRILGHINKQYNHTSSSSQSVAQQHEQQYPQEQMQRQFQEGMVVFKNVIYKMLDRNLSKFELFSSYILSLHHIPTPVFQKLYTDYINLIGEELPSQHNINQQTTKNTNNKHNSSTNSNNNNINPSGLSTYGDPSQTPSLYRNSNRTTPKRRSKLLEDMGEVTPSSFFHNNQHDSQTRNNNSTQSNNVNTSSNNNNNNIKPQQNQQTNNNDNSKNNGNVSQQQPLTKQAQLQQQLESNSRRIQDLLAQLQHEQDKYDLMYTQCQTMQHDLILLHNCSTQVLTTQRQLQQQQHQTNNNPNANNSNNSNNNNNNNNNKNDSTRTNNTSNNNNNNNITNKKDLQPKVENIKKYGPILMNQPFIDITTTTQPSGNIPHLNLIKDVSITTLQTLDNKLTQPRSNSHLNKNNNNNGGNNTNNNNNNNNNVKQQRRLDLPNRGGDTNIDGNNNNNNNVQQQAMGIYPHNPQGINRLMPHNNHDNNSTANNNNNNNNNNLNNNHIYGSAIKPPIYAQLTSAAGVGLGGTVPTTGNVHNTLQPQSSFNIQNNNNNNNNNSPTTNITLSQLNYNIDRMSLAMQQLKQNKTQLTQIAGGLGIVLDLSTPMMNFTRINIPQQLMGNNNNNNAHSYNQTLTTITPGLPIYTVNRHTVDENSPYFFLMLHNSIIPELSNTIVTTTQLQLKLPSNNNRHNNNNNNNRQNNNNNNHLLYPGQNKRSILPTTRQNDNNMRYNNNIHNQHHQQPRIVNIPKVHYIKPNAAIIFNTNFNYQQELKHINSPLLLTELALQLPLPQAAAVAGTMMSPPPQQQTCSKFNQNVNLAMTRNNHLNQTTVQQYEEFFSTFNQSMKVLGGILYGTQQNSSNNNNNNNNSNHHTSSGSNNNNTTSQQHLSQLMQQQQQQGFSQPIQHNMNFIHQNGGGGSSSSSNNHHHHHVDLLQQQQQSNYYQMNSAPAVSFPFINL